jgi:hypothetical protein
MEVLGVLAGRCAGAALVVDEAGHALGRQQALVVGVVERAVAFRPVHENSQGERPFARRQDQAAGEFHAPALEARLFHRVGDPLRRPFKMLDPVDGDRIVIAAAQFDPRRMRLVAPAVIAGPHATGILRQRAGAAVYRAPAQGAVGQQSDVEHSAAVQPVAAGMARRHILLRKRARSRARERPRDQKGQYRFETCHAHSSNVRSLNIGGRSIRAKFKLVHESSSAARRAAWSSAIRAVITSSSSSPATIWSSL